MVPALAARQVDHRFPGRGGVDVLDGVSLSVDAGSFVSVVGPSGCGKSTLLRMLAGLVVPTAGEVEVEGTPVAGRPGRTAYQPQRDLLLPWLRVLENATLGAEVAGVPRGAARAAARARLERFGLAGFERAWPPELSGGMRQRLALLRTFLTPRSVLLLDEPFGALDAITRRDLHQWLQAVREDDPRTVLLVTHDVEEALVLSDTVVVFSERPAHVVTEVAVGLARPRPASIVTEPEFVALKAKLLAALEAGRHGTGSTR
jgi:ABC-type nitrate/sulfonate/bicarbonate transport system ATPase subunit